MEINGETLAGRLQGQAVFTLLDIRETWELARGLLPEAVHIAMSELENRAAELPKAIPLVVYCEHGVRSLHVAAWLIQQGYQAESLAGGFAAWHGPVSLPETKRL
jgi:rhodanese-related sulfurtransferase